MKKQITKTIERARARSKKEKNNWISFLKEYSIIGMAMGVIVAEISKDLIAAFVKGIFVPLINIIIPNSDWQNMVWKVEGVEFDIGNVLGAFMTFLIVLFFLYVIVKKIIRDDELTQKK